MSHKPCDTLTTDEGGLGKVVIQIVPNYAFHVRNTVIIKYIFPNERVCLKAGTVEPEETFIARQRLRKHVSATKSSSEILLETVFPVGSAPRLYNEAELMIEKVQLRIGSRRIEKRW
jgi:hypothetical protein